MECVEEVITICEPRCAIRTHRLGQHVPDPLIDHFPKAEQAPRPLSASGLLPNVVDQAVVYRLAGHQLKANQRQPEEIAAHILGLSLHSLGRTVAK